jgi:hypothetical protein
LIQDLCLRLDFLWLLELTSTFEGDAARKSVALQKLQREHMPDSLKIGILTCATLLILIAVARETSYRSLSHATLSNTNLAADCILTIRSSLVPLMSEPKRFSKEIIRLNPGEYSPLEHKVVSSGAREEGWFQIESKGRKGWIADDTWAIDRRSSSCP